MANKIELINMYPTTICYPLKRISFGPLLNAEAIPPETTEKAKMYVSLSGLRQTINYTNSTGYNVQAAGLSTCFKQDAQKKQKQKTGTILYSGTAE